MFHHIEGKVTDLEPGAAVLECMGVGFALNTTLTTISHLKLGERAKLYVSESVREDCFDLYGFWSKSERRSFELLLGVSGVGPKAALSILSAGTPESLAMAILSGDEKALTVAPGIGKKIAQRIILELKDKLGKLPTLPQGTLSVEEVLAVDDRTEAVNALIALGYSKGEAITAIAGIEDRELTAEEYIKRALKQMMR